MQSRKSRPLLLEVKGRTGPGESGNDSPDDAHDAGKRPVRTMFVRSRPARETAREVSPAADSSAGPSWLSGVSVSGLLPVLRYDANNVNVALTWPGAAVAGCVLLLVLIVTFVAGRMSAAGATEAGPSGGKLDAILGPAGTNASGDSRTGTPARVVSQETRDAEGTTPPAPQMQEPPHVAVPNRASRAEAPPQAEDLPRQPADAQRVSTAPLVDETALQKGRSYLLIQYFPDETPAVSAAAFLMERGVPCMIVKRKKEYILYGSESYMTKQDSASAAREERNRLAQMKERVKQVGKDYFPIGGYAFEGTREIYYR